MGVLVEVRGARGRRWAKMPRSTWTRTSARTREPILREEKKMGSVSAVIVGNETQSTCKSGLAYTAC